MRIHGTRQTGFFTKLPNAAARDHALSFTARGLLAYMLTLPSGAREDVRTLADKSVEGRGAVSRALHELEARGYLTRTKSRDGGGRIRTDVEVFADRDGVSPQVEPATVAPGTGRPGDGASGSKTEEGGLKDSLPPHRQPEGRQGGEREQPSRSASLLSRLGRDEPRLHLGAKEAAALAPLVDDWLAKGVTQSHLTSVLTAGLPARVHQAAALLRHRLVTKMPTDLPPRTPRIEWHECADCRAPLKAAGSCSGCRSVNEAENSRTALRSMGRAGFQHARAQLRSSAAAA